MNNKLLTTLLATSTFSGILGAIYPQAAMAQADYIDACKLNDGNGNALVYYSHDGVNKSIIANPRNNGQIRKTRVKNHLENRHGLTDSEAENVKDDIPNTVIANMPLCLSEFPFYRGNSNQTAFHSVTDSNGNIGADAFQQFSNTESSALDLSTLNARKLDTTRLELTYDNDVKVYFINEGAGYRNQLAINATRTTPVSGMLFNNVSCHNTDPDCQGKWSSPSDPAHALKAGDYVDVGTLLAGTKLDFQVLANGYSNPNPDIWYTDDSLNSDGLQHVIAYAYEGYLVLGWEDINGGGDMDYNDVVFAIYIGDDNLAAIPTDPVSNNAPSALDDSAVTPYETAVTVSVLNGDTDADGDVLNLDSIATNPANGTVTISGDDVVYTPNTGFSGIDTFEYNVADTQGATDIGTVTVTVGPAPTPANVVGCPATPNAITLGGIIRDFSASHPDFQYRTGSERDIVTTDLGLDGKPVYGNHPNGTRTTTGKDNFDQWYNTTPGVNQSLPYSVTLNRVPGTDKFRYENTSFFPIDGQLGAESRNDSRGNPRNFHFTYEIKSQFTYRGDDTEYLEFSGDDDVWVYINGQRVVDLGGVHMAEDATVTLDAAKAAQLGLVAGETYDFKFFFAERHTVHSNFILETNIDLWCDTDSDGLPDPEDDRPNNYDTAD